MNNALNELKDEHNPLLQNMKKDSPLYRALSVSGQEQATRAARILQGHLDAVKAVPPAVAGCKYCLGRLENPHANYVMPAILDTSKI